MKLTVVADQHGNIVSVSHFGDVGEKISGITSAGVEAGNGQSVHEIDVPGELETISLLDIHTGYKLDVNAKRLVKG